MSKDITLEPDELHIWQDFGWDDTTGYFTGKFAPVPGSGYTSLYELRRYRN